MSDLIYPTLDLFLYDLRNDLGESVQGVNKNRERFARKLPEAERQELGQRDTDSEVEYVELLGNRQISRFCENSSHYMLEGWYYPVRLNDMYGLLLDCSANLPQGSAIQAKNAIFPLQCFGELKSEIDTRLAGSVPTIGQIWMISAQLPQFTESIAESVAKACCQISELGIDWQHTFRGQDDFLGGKLFEFWRYKIQKLNENEALEPSTPPRIHDIQDNHTIIVALYPNELTARKAAEFNFDWIRIFAYRSKILWAYGQSRYLKNQLNKQFVDIRQYIEEFQRTQPRNLDSLRTLLFLAQTTLLQYSTLLNLLNTQRRTIEINLLNYRRRLQVIYQQSISASLSIFEQFAEDVEQRYLLQVQHDHENFSLGVTLLTDLINSIRGIVEVDQAGRDRTFQSAVAIIGVGLASSSLVASFTGQLPEPSKIRETTKALAGSDLTEINIPDTWLPLILSVLLSTIIGIGSALLTAVVIKIANLIKR